jgi:DNA-binding CsgD family transcriptional regulator
MPTKEMAMKATAVVRVVSLCQGAPKSTVSCEPVTPSSPAMVYGLEPRKLRLTVRELEVLSLLCEGLPNKLICRRLNICTGTVKCHVASILNTLGVSSRLQAVVAAHRLGLVRESEGEPQELEDDCDSDDMEVLRQTVQAARPVRRITAAA